jgi:hypothetical protein
MPLLTLPASILRNAARPAAVRALIQIFKSLQVAAGSSKKDTGNSRLARLSQVFTFDLFFLHAHTHFI